MRETFGLLFLVTACALTWGQVGILASASQPPVNAIGIMIALTLIAYIFAYVASGDRVNKVIKNVLSFIGGGQCLILLSLMGRSITGYGYSYGLNLNIHGYIILFMDVIAFGVYSVVVGDLLPE